MAMRPFSRNRNILLEMWVAIIINHFLQRVLKVHLQELTLADLYHLPYGHVVTNAGIDILHSDKWPNVARYVPTFCR